MAKFKYYVIFKSSGTLSGTWTGLIEEFTEKFITPNVNDIYSYQIWEDIAANAPDPDVDDISAQKLDADMFDQMIEQHEMEELEQDVAEQWAREQYLREVYAAGSEYAAEAKYYEDPNLENPEC